MSPVYYVGQRVTTSDWGREVSATIVRLGRSVLWIRIDGSKVQQFRFPHTIIPLRRKP